MNGALLELELSRYRGFMPGKRSKAWGTLAAAFAAAFFFCLGCDQFLQLRSFGQASVLATVFAIGAGSALMYFSENYRRADSFFDWWIRLPHPRFELVKAQFLANCMVGYVLYAVAWSAAMAAHALRIYTGETSAADPPAGLLASIVIGLGAAPVVVAYGQLSTVFTRRRWYVMLAGFIYLTAGVGGAIGLLGAVLADEMLLLRIADGPLWTAALITIGAGWPLAYGMLRLASRYGLANLADSRNVMTSERRAAAWRRVRPDASAAASLHAEIRNPRHALFRMEWSRVTLYANTLPGRIAAGVLAAGLACGGWFAYGNSMAAVIVPLAPAAIVNYIFMLSVSILMSADIQQRKLVWQLLLPIPRRDLVLGKLYAYWAAGLAAAGIMYGSFWAGMIIRCLLEGQPLASLTHDASWAVYCFVQGIAAFAAVVAIVFGTMAASVSFPQLSVLLALVYLIPTFGSQRLIAVYFPKEELMDVVSPYWGLMGITAAASFVIAFIYIVISVRTIDSLAKAKQQRNGWGFSGGKPSA